MKIDRMIQMRNINNTLLDWALHSHLYHCVCSPDETANQHLEKALSDNQENKFKSSLWLFSYIWDKYPELGPCPQLELLAEAENDRVFLLDIAIIQLMRLKYFYWVYFSMKKIKK